MVFTQETVNSNIFADDQFLLLAQVTVFVGDQAKMLEITTSVTLLKWAQEAVSNGYTQQDRQRLGEY